MRALMMDEVGFVSGCIQNPFINPARPNEVPTPTERAWQSVELYALRNRVADEILTEAVGLLIDSANGRVFANAAKETLEKFVKGEVKDAQTAAAELFGEELAAKIFEGQDTAKNIIELINKIGAMLLEYKNRIHDQARYGSGFD